MCAVLSSCCVRFSSGAYHPLNPVLQPQPSSVKIYPGLSGPLSISQEDWNSYTLRAPSSDMLQQMYDQGRRDAAAYVTANIPSAAGPQVSSALEVTARNVASVPMPITLEGALSAVSTVLSTGGMLGDVIDGVARLASNGVPTSITAVIGGK